MHCILALLGAPGCAWKHILKRAQTVLSSTLPDFPIPSAWELEGASNGDGGWLLLRPADEKLRQVVSSWSAGGTSVLCYGEVYGSEEKSSAQVILEAYKAGGIAEVRALDGNFGALVYEADSRTCTLVSDMFGRRSLRFWASPEYFVVSTHDMAAVATGFVSPLPRLSAIASSIVFGWSLGGRPFLSDLSNCQPDEVVVWRDGELQRKPSNTLMLARRGLGDRRAHHEAVLEKLVEFTGHGWRGQGRLKIDLTAGLDSRCVLALALAAGVDPKAIVATTMGGVKTHDVIIAAKLARKYGIVHEVIAPAALLQTADFLKHLEILAFALNGDTDGKRAVDQIFGQAEFVDPTTHFNGIASEIYRGVYYPRVSAGLLRELTLDSVTDWLWRRCGAGRESLPWVDRALPEAVANRLDQRISHYAANARAPVDVLDLFYLHDRFARWGALSARATWWAHYFAPFASVRVLQLWFQLPAPVGYGVSLHRQILKRHLPDSYWWPLINGLAPAPFLGVPRLAAGSAAITKRLSRAPQETRDTLSGDALGSSFRAAILEVLLGDGSLTTRLLKEEGVVRIVHDLAKGRRSLGNLGVLLCAERWHSQIQKTWAAVSRSQ